MSLGTPNRIRRLQRKLYRKAKDEPAYRFYLLYDKIYREDILYCAYERVKYNRGGPGVDGQTLAEIESAGLGKWLAGIREELRTRTYRAQPVRRAMRPKPGGGERPLGIPDDSGPGGTGCGQTGVGADLRGGYGTVCLWLPAEAQRAGRDTESARTSLCGLHRGGGRRSVQILRYHSTLRTDAVGRSADRGPRRPATDQAMAESSGGRAGWARETAHDGRQETAAAGHRRVG